MKRYHRIADAVWAQVYATVYAQLVETETDETAAIRANTAADDAVTRMTVGHDLRP